MGQIKYEYRSADKSPIGVPSIVLKKGETGVISRVDFHRDKDYVRGELINFSFTNLGLQRALATVESNNLISLEQCTEDQLEIVSKSFLYRGGRTPLPDLPLDELEQLRELEIELRTNMGEYRSTR